MSRLGAAEFFAGIGLVRLALHQVGWDVEFANDIDRGKFEMYRDNFGDRDFVLGDVRNIRAESVPEVAVATASFPCVDLSLAGNRRGLDGDDSSAYWGFHKIINKMGRRRPSVVLLENVVGLLSSNGGEDLRAIVASLNKLGYSCDAFVADAVHFVPQSRPRLLVTGFLEAAANRISDVPVHQSRPRKLVEFVFQHRNLKWTHTKLASLPPKRSDLIELLEQLDENAPEWWDVRRQQHLHSQMSPSHRKVLRSLVEKENISFATVYKRVRPAGCRAELRADGVAGCLRTPRGGSSKQFVIQAGFGEWRVRNMTAREYARLQGVPDSFRINVPYNQALFGFGDAVCVPAVEWALRNVAQYH